MSQHPNQNNRDEGHPPEEPAYLRFLVQNNLRPGEEPRRRESVPAPPQRDSRMSPGDEPDPARTNLGYSFLMGPVRPPLRLEPSAVRQALRDRELDQQRQQASARPTRAQQSRARRIHEAFSGSRTVRAEEFVMGPSPDMFLPPGFLGPPLPRSRNSESERYPEGQQNMTFRQLIRRYIPLTNPWLPPRRPTAENSDDTSPAVPLWPPGAIALTGPLDVRFGGFDLGGLDSRDDPMGMSHSPWTSETTQQEEQASQLISRQQILGHRGSRWRRRAGDRAEDEFDIRMVAGYDPDTDPWVYSFALRYCSGGFQPRRNTSSGSGTGNGASQSVEIENVKRPLSMEFLPCRGNLVRRFEQWRPSTPLGLYPQPPTEAILLQPINRRAFRTTKIRLALWPQIKNDFRTHCAVFLISGTTPGIQATLDHTIVYDSPTGQDNEPNNPRGGAWPRPNATHIALLPEAFQSTISDCKPTVTRDEELDLKFPANERGIVGVFTDSSPFRYNVRVDRENPHLVPPALDAEYPTFETIVGDVVTSLENGQEGRDSDEDVTMAESYTPGTLLIPHAKAELSDHVTTIEFPEAISTDAILIKFWKSWRSNKEVTLRMLEVHGTDGMRILKSKPPMR